MNELILHTSINAGTQEAVSKTMNCFCFSDVFFLLRENRSGFFSFPPQACSVLFSSHDCTWFPDFDK
jgi:hypothetical protein